jgi:hypothetical protein
MREISEQEAFELAGESDCPVLRKEEAEALEAAVCLKQFPGGYVLGVSDKIRDLRLWFTRDLDVAEREYDRYVGDMRAHGSPFGAESSSGARGTC